MSTLHLSPERGVKDLNSNTTGIPGSHLTPA